MKLKYLVLAIFVSGCSSVSFTKSTVKITNLASTSGGSGSIVRVSKTRSEVLTNGHVCGVVKNGGLIHTYDNQVYFVSSYKISEMHDLCLISVEGNLRYPATISETSPRKFDESIVVGHPKLLPTILTKGHFSDKMIIQIMAGARECTDADRNDPNTGFFCMMFGKVPVIKTYETIVVSSLIQPGSSGSAVYGADGKITAVIFAGSGDLGYGLAVPHEYVYNFLETESKWLKSELPNNEISLGSSQETHNSTNELVRALEKYCSENKEVPPKQVCKIFEQVNKYDDLIEHNEE